MNDLCRRDSFKAGLKEERVLGRSLRPHDAIFGSASQRVLGTVMGILS